MSNAGVCFTVIRDELLENNQVRKEYERLGKMGLLVKESQEEAKVLFITNMQYNVLESFLEVMEFEDGTSIKVVDADKSIYINTCGLQVAIISPELDIELITRNFNYIFVDTELNYGLDKWNELRCLIEAKCTYKYYNCGIYVVNSFEASEVCNGLMEAFGGEELFDYGYEDEEWEDYDYDEDYDDYGDWFSTDYDDEDYEEDEEDKAPYKVERQED